MLFTSNFIFQYQVCSTVLSVGGLRQQFTCEENIEMSLYGADFLRNINDHLGIFNEPRIDVQFHPYGYLTLAQEHQSDVLRQSSKLQNEKGARNVILTAKELALRFPWLNTNDIDCGCLGIEKEGWFDPWLLLMAFKKKNLKMGVEYVEAEALGFNFKINPDAYIAGMDPHDVEELEYLVVNLFFKFSLMFLRKFFLKLGLYKEFLNEFNKNPCPHVNNYGKILTWN